MKIIVIGAGGHGKVVVDTCHEAGWTVLGTADTDPHRTVFGLPHLGAPDNLRIEQPDVRAVIAIGSNAARRNIAQRLEGRLSWASVIHPAATVSRKARVEEGAVILAGAVVEADAVVGRHAIVNTGSQVGHDNTVGAFCHVASGAVLAGTVTLGEGVLVGVGAAVLPNCTLGEWGSIGANGVVWRDTEAGFSYFGVPVKRVPGRVVEGHSGS